MSQNSKLEVSIEDESEILDGDPHFFDKNHDEISNISDKERFADAKQIRTTNVNQIKKLDKELAKAVPELESIRIKHDAESNKLKSGHFNSWRRNEKDMMKQIAEF